jgi:hypothetical protein
MASSMAANQKAPFYLDFAPEESITQDQSWVSNVTSVTVSVTIVNNATDTSTQYGGLTTSNLNGANNGGAYTVSGTIQDTGDQSVGDVAAVATFYNSNGTVVALGLTDLGASLAPGQSTSFAVTPFDDTATLSSEIESYAILVQSTPTSPTATPESTATPTIISASPGGTTNPTQNPSTTSSILAYAIVIVVVAVVAVIAVLILIRKRGSVRQIEAPTSAPTSPPSTP